MKHAVLLAASALALVGSLATRAWSGAPAAPAADVAPPTAELSGTLAAPAEAVAPIVDIRNIDRDVIYSVFAVDGRYRAPHLFPGRYEVWVDQNGLADTRVAVTIAAGAKATLDLAPATVAKTERYVGARFIPGAVPASYESIYPAAPARATIERTCIVCHGVNFLPAMHQSRDAWQAAVDYMTGGHAFGVAANPSLISPDRITEKEKAEVVDYLAKNFDEKAPKRAVRLEQGPPLDKALLGKAMYVEYRLAKGVDDPLRTTQETAFDRDGNVWVTETHFPGMLIRLDPRTGAKTEFPTPNPNWQPHGLIVDNDNTIWFGGEGTTLGHFDPKSRKWDLYPAAKGYHSLSPFFDSKGDIFFTSLPGNEIGKWDRATNTVKRWRIPTPLGAGYGILVGRDDKVWFDEFYACKMARFDPGNEQFTEYAALSRPCLARRLGMDRQGNVWFGLHSGGKIARLDAGTGKITEYPIPVPYASPYDAWPDPAGHIWATSDNYLIRLDPATGKLGYYPTTRQTDMPKMSITRDGAVWYPTRGSSSSKGGPPSAQVLYPDKDAIPTFAARYHPDDLNLANITRYKGPGQPVTGTGDDGGGDKARTAPARSRNPNVGAAAD